MLETSLINFACTNCNGDLYISKIHNFYDDRIKDGTITCKSCSNNYKVSNYIPRFVSNENYAKGFGYQWKKHIKTQYDSYNGLNLSKDRFYNSTLWPSNLSGEIILEVGAGAGRFTEIASSTNATVVSLDYSEAVEANYSMNGAKNNIIIAQGDIYKMPFRKHYFDKIFCFGVLQHTPDVKKAFMSLPAFLKPEGQLVVDIYKKTIVSTLFSTKYYVRPFLCKKNPKQLYKFVKMYVDLMWPFVSLIAKIPKFGKGINSRLLVAEYSNYGLCHEMLKEMAYLDTFDMLSPEYDTPQTKKTIMSWFKEARLENIDVSYGYNGIVGRGKTSLRNF